MDTQLKVTRTESVSEYVPTASVPRPSHKHDEPVNHPAHYNQSGVECIDAIQAMLVDKPATEGYLAGAVLKYLWRYQAKGKPVEDLKKARWYIDRLITEVEAR